MHDTPGIWSIYHTIDSELSNPFESYQMLDYVNNQIPHIPISAEGLDKKDLYVISTTNWQPYTWSTNNVALAEQLHTSYDGYSPKFELMVLIGQRSSTSSC